MLRLREQWPRRDGRMHRREQDGSSGHSTLGSGMNLSRFRSVTLALFCLALAACDVVQIPTPPPTQATPNTTATAGTTDQPTDTPVPTDTGEPTPTPSASPTPEP